MVTSYPYPYFRFVARLHQSRDSVANLPKLRPHNSNEAEYYVYQSALSMLREVRKGVELQYVSLFFLLLFSLIIGKTKNITLCPLLRHIYMIHIFKAQMPSKCQNYSSKGPDLFLSGRIFPPDWPETSAMKWQHIELQGGGIPAE